MNLPLIPDPATPIGALIRQVLAFVMQRHQPAWLVGGYLRDLLLGRPSHDLDVVVADGAIRLTRDLAAAFHGAWFVLDNERDVGRALLPAADGCQVEVDVARLRVPDLLDDLALRDFTVNAIALDLQQNGPPYQLFDPFDGRLDLERRLLRAVTDGAFRDDPLRMLRGVRIAAELGFRVEAATANLIRRDAPRLALVAPERIRDELMRILIAPGAWQHLRLLAQLELLSPVLPESAAQIGVTQSPPHYQDVFDHSRSVVGHLEGIYALLWPASGYGRPAPVAGDPTIIAPAVQWDELAERLAPYADLLRAHLMAPLASGHTRRDLLLWAAMAHDWGKPARRTEDDAGHAHFYDHERWGALLAATRLQALRMASDEVAYVARLTAVHMGPGQLARSFPLTRRAIYRFYRDAGNTGPDCALLSLADHLASHASKPDYDYWRRRLETACVLWDAYFHHHAERVAPPPLLNGHQIMAALGRKAGPWLGQLLEGLREAQAAGEVSTAEDAWAWVRDHAGEGA
ncbi:MAG: HD domain-containing protein [Anaerolineae bacterium]